MTDILDRLSDLHKQATEERSHYYTGSVIKEAIAEILRLRVALGQAELRYGNLVAVTAPSNAGSER